MTSKTQTAPPLAARIGGRLRREAMNMLVRSGTAIAGGHAFEYWAKVSDIGYSGPNSRRINDEFLARGARQLEFLKQLGLEPQDFMLDYGCAVLRTAQFVVPYLERGHYVGADVGRLCMRNGVLRLEEAGIARHRYHLASLHSPELSELDGFRFDFIFSDSVLQYLSDDDLATVVGAFRRLIGPKGIVYASFPDEGSKAVLRKKGNFFRSAETMRSICERAGFDCRLFETPPSGYPASPYLLLSPRT